MVWVQLAWFVVKLVLSVAISYALAPKPNTPPDAARAGLDSFNVPTAIVGREIPVLFGTKLLTGPNCVWSGDLQQRPITETVDGGLFSSDSDVTVGWRNYLSMHLILAPEIDAITKIEVDQNIIFEGESTGGEISINKPNILGGDSSRGGVSGTVDFERGLPDQPQNAYLQSQLGTYIPAFRGVAGVVLRGV
jgi:hypothetical protein